MVFIISFYRCYGRKRRPAPPYQQQQQQPHWKYSEMRLPVIRSALSHSKNSSDKFNIAMCGFNVSYRSFLFTCCSGVFGGVCCTYVVVVCSKQSNFWDFHLINIITVVCVWKKKRENNSIHAHTRTTAHEYEMKEVKVTVPADIGMTCVTVCTLI